MVHPDLIELVALIDARATDFAAARCDGVLPNWLYQNWYISPEGSPANDAAAPPCEMIAAGLNAIVDAQSAWSNGWIVMATDADGGCLAAKGAARRWASVGRYCTEDRPGLPPAPGDRISIPDMLAWHDDATDQWASQSPAPPRTALVRLYLNAGPCGIGHAIERLISRFGDEQIAFRMKCPANVAGFGRADALTVYLERDAWRRHEPMVRSWAEELEPVLRPGRPALTRPIAFGVAFAEDPDGGQSFGQHRCNILASAIVERWHRPGDRPAHLASALVDAGIAADEPWRSAS